MQPQPEKTLGLTTTFTPSPRTGTPVHTPPQPAPETLVAEPGEYVV